MGIWHSKNKSKEPSGSRPKPLWRPRPLKGNGQQNTPEKRNRKATSAAGKVGRSDYCSYNSGHHNSGGFHGGGHYDYGDSHSGEHHDSGGCDSGGCDSGGCDSGGCDSGGCGGSD